MQPIKVLREAVSKVPFVKYALGVAGVAAAIAIIKTFGIDNYQVPVISILIFLGLMVLLFVFSSLTKSQDKTLKRGGYALVYTTIIITCLSALLLFTSVFFKFPDRIENIVIAPRAENSDTTQVQRWMNSIKFKYLTYDKMDFPTNLNIEFCAFYDQSERVFINSSNCEFNITSKSDYLALIDGISGKPMKVKINNDVFEVTYDDWKTIDKKERINFRNWNNSTTSLTVKDFLN